MHGQLAGWNFMAGECIDQLFLTTLRVAGGQCDHLHMIHIAGLCQCFTHGTDRFGFIVFNGDQAGCCIDHMHDNAHAGENVIGILSHQAVVAGQIRLALNAVENHRFNRAALVAYQLDEGGKYRTTEPGQATYPGPLAQDSRVRIGPVGYRIQTLIMAVITITFDEDRGHAHAGGMGCRVLFDFQDRAGGGGMYRH